MERMENDPKDAPELAAAEKPADTAMALHERIQRSREIMAELDGRLAASREAELRAAVREDEARDRNPVRIRRPSE